MKNRFLFLLAIVAMLFACSEDSTFTDLTKSADQTTLNSEFKKGHNGKVVVRPFKIKGSGTFNIVGEPDDPCIYGLPQVLISGQGNASHLGLFSVEITYCTNFTDIHIAEGFQIAANGDEIFFYSNNLVNPGDVGFDEGGAYAIYHYTHGTGRFKDVTGFIKLYGIQEYIDPNQPWLGGTYTNQGEGEIAY